MIAVEVLQSGTSDAAGHLHRKLAMTLHIRVSGPRVLTVGTWLTYGSCTIVPIVFATDRSANSK
jgi:hypothetical protein